MAFQDRPAGLEVLLAYYRDVRDTKKGVEVADELARDSQHAKTALYIKGELLQWSGDYPKAIEAYRQSDNIPQSLFQIAECQLGLKKTDLAISQLKEIEFLGTQFPQAASQAAWRMAQIYKDSGNTKMVKATLHQLMQKYKESWESCYTHLALKEMGLSGKDLGGGGMDADEK